MENDKLKRFGAFMLDNAIIFSLLILVIIIIILEPSFVSLDNFVKILSQASTRVIFALGVGGILVAKGTDLSLGRQVGLAAVVSASLLQAPDYAYRMYPDLPQLPVFVPILIVMGLCGLIGLTNGFIVAKLKVDPFITTLGMMIIVYGMTSLYFDRPPYGAQPVGGLDPSFMNFAQGYFEIGALQIPYLIIYAAITAAIIWVLWNKTKFGKYMFAVGGNKEAAIVSGVNVVKYLMLVYMLSGVLYGLGGALEAARIGSATNNTGNAYEMDAIAACIVGGFSFSGGVGTVRGVIIGVLVFQVIAYGMNYIGISPYFQNIVKGIIIIAAVALDSYKRKRLN